VLTWRPAAVLAGGALLLILVLERKYPAVASQKTLSKGLVNDALWVLVEAVVNVAIIRWYSGSEAKLAFARYTTYGTPPPPAWS
jgi:hypothetical protein